MKKIGLSLAVIFSVLTSFFIGRQSLSVHPSGVAIEPQIPVVEAPLPGIQSKAELPLSRSKDVAAKPPGLAARLYRALNNREAGTRHEALGELFKSLSADEIPEVFKLLGKETEALTAENELVAELLVRWAASNSKEALAWAQGLPSFKLRTGMTQKILEAWASSDPKEAADFALSQPPGNQRDGLLEAVMKKWFASDPDGAVSWISSISGPRTRNRLLARALGNYARINPKGAASYVHLITSAQEREEAYMNIAREWADQDPVGAVAWAKDWPATMRWEIWMMLLGRLTGMDRTDLAVQLVMSRPESKTQIDLLGNLARQWAQNDLEGAIAWFKTLPPGRGRDKVFECLGGDWGDVDPKGALAYAQSLPSSVSVRNFIASVVGSWVQNDPAAAADWALSIPDSAQRKDMLVNFVIKSWTGTAPEAAATYAAALQDGELQTAAVLKIVGESTFWNGADLAAWVGKFPPGDLRDQCVAMEVNSAFSDPPAVVAMLDACNDPQLIQKYGEQIGNAWLNRDPNSATAWIQNSALGNDVKQRLLSRIK
ncbi:MAG: hypothetical protein ACLQVY_25550 [Limisphaerales bacterium]